MEPSNDLTAAAAPATLGPGQALLVLLTFFAAQFFGALVVALVGGVWFALKQGAAALESATERALIMPSVLAGAVCGGVFSFLLTWLLLRTTEPPRLRSIGWSCASPRDLLIASLAGLGWLLPTSLALSHTSRQRRGTTGDPSSRLPARVAGRNICGPASAY